jgi:ATP-dependent Clp protease ATP-binding subunit ClpX
LTRDDLVKILTEPKNASSKQYQKLLELDNVELEIQPQALQEVAKKALDRQIGARGLREIMESVMTKIMYTIPSDLSIKKVVITRDAVLGGEPKILRDPKNPRVKPGKNK